VRAQGGNSGGGGSLVVAAVAYGLGLWALGRSLGRGRSHYDLVVHFRGGSTDSFFAAVAGVLCCLRSAGTVATIPV